MKVVRKTYIKCLSFLFTLFGFAAIDGCMISAYGSPSAAYKVVGKVASEKTKEPIQNVQVVMRSQPYTYINAYGDTAVHDNGERATTYTGSDGSFTVRIVSESSSGDATYLLDFTDANGVYADKRDSAVFKNAKFEGKDDWYDGEATLNKGTVELKLKE